MFKRHRAAVRRSAGLFLPLLFVFLTILSNQAAAEPVGDRHAAAVAAVAKTGLGSGAADVLRRLTAPLAAAMAAPNIMAADAGEHGRQLVHFLQKDQERRVAAKERAAAKADAAAVAFAAAAGQAACAPLPTAPPSLARLVARQDDSGQIAALSGQIQSLSLVASSLSQASREVSQTSQQLAQQVTQLAQSTGRLQQSIGQLQQSAQQAQQSAQQAQQSAQQAQQSASRAISEAQSSAASSASAALASSLASITSSASSMISAARVSAVSVANSAASQVQLAQADATVARADAATQVEKAQGAAVSVTQAALAVVGTFFASSLLSIGAFYVVLRVKGNRRRRRTRLLATRGGQDDTKPWAGDGVSEKDRQRNSDNDSEYGRAIDLKAPPPARRPGPGPGDNDRGLGDSKPLPDRAPYLSDPAGSSTGLGIALFPSSNSLRGMGMSRTSFSLFPKSPASSRLPPHQPGVVSPSVYTTGSSAPASPQIAVAVAVPAAVSAAAADGNPLRPPPSLQQWLREGTVSPFGTLKKGSLAVLSSSQTGVRSVGAGGSTGGPVMQPGRSLPFRVRP